MKQAGKQGFCIGIPSLVWWHLCVERHHWFNSHWNLLDNMFVVLEWCLLSMNATVFFTPLHCWGFTINIRCQSTYFIFFLLLMLCKCCRQFVRSLFYVMLLGAYIIDWTILSLFNGCYIMNLANNVISWWCLPYYISLIPANMICILLYIPHLHILHCTLAFSRRQFLNIFNLDHTRYESTLILHKSLINSAPVHRCNSYFTLFC